MSSKKKQREYKLSGRMQQLAARKAEIAAAYNRGVSLSEMAEHYKVCQKTLRKLLVVLGIGDPNRVVVRKRHSQHVNERATYWCDRCLAYATRPCVACRAREFRKENNLPL